MYLNDVLNSILTLNESLPAVGDLRDKLADDRVPSEGVWCGHWVDGFDIDLLKCLKIFFGGLVASEELLFL